MSNKDLLEAEEEVKDAEYARDIALEDLLSAVKWFERCEAKLNLERINLQLLKKKNI